MTTQPRLGRDMVRSRRDLVYQQGTYVLLALYVALLAGRFSISRIADGSLPSFALDLRFVFLAFVIFLVLLWAAGVQKVGITRKRMRGLIPFGLWCLWLALSVLWVPSGADSSESLLDIFFLLSFTLLAWWIMAQLDGSHLEQIWKWVLITGLVYFALALTSPPDAQGRFAVPGGGPNTFVRIMVVAAIAALYLIATRSKRWPIATLPLFAAGAILSGSRGGMLSAIVIFVLFLIPVVKILRARGVIALLIAGSIGAYGAAHWRDGFIFTVVRERFIQQTVIEQHASGRDVIVEQAWGMFLSNPIFGVGLNGFDYLESGPSDYGYAHNLFLSTLAETGLIGGALLLLALGRLVFLAFDKSANRGNLFALMGGLFFLGSSMFSGDYYDSRFVWFFLVLAVMSTNRSSLKLDTDYKSVTRKI